MHIVAIGWMFVVVMMAAAEATAPNGTVLGAFFTLLLYGVLPLGIVLYILGTPARKAARRRAELAQSAAAADQAASTGTGSGSGEQRDGGGQAPGAGLAAERKEP